MDIRKIVSWIIVVFWMTLIFYFSSQVGQESGQLSTGITQFIINMIESIYPNITIDVSAFNLLIRKAAHMFVYFVLGILIMNALKTSRVYGYRAVVISLFVCVVYAISDEIHQLFVPGRCGQITDVIIDSIGAILGIVMYGVAYRVISIFRKCKTTEVI